LELLTGDPSKRPRASKSHGYTLIPDYIKDKGDRIELLIKVRRINQLCPEISSDFSAAAAPHLYCTSVDGRDSDRVNRKVR
jgi:hypothetical protein